MPSDPGWVFLALLLAALGCAGAMADRPTAPSNSAVWTLRLIILGLLVWSVLHYWRDLLGFVLGMAILGGVFLVCYIFALGVTALWPRADVGVVTLINLVAAMFLFGTIDAVQSGRGTWGYELLATEALGAIVLVVCALAGIVGLIGSAMDRRRLRKMRRDRADTG